MLNPEEYDAEFFEAIKGFLAQQKEGKETSELEVAARVLGELFCGDWEALQGEVMCLAKLWRLRRDFTSIPVFREQAVRYSPQLAKQNQEVLDLIDEIGYAKEGIYRIAYVDRGKTHIPRAASIRQVSSPLPIDGITIDQFNSRGFRYMSDVINALQIPADGGFTRISITGVASGLTDRQTRTGMEQIFLKLPEASKTLTACIGTSYYIFGERIGKLVRRPTPLLEGRSLDPRSNTSLATSEFTSGDEYLAKVALKVVNDKLLSFR